jgi:PIN domain nuclease of toxin-antitoxin system
MPRLAGAMLNLDTHILIRALAGELTPREAGILSGERWGISAIVLWEIAKLSQLGRIEVDFDSAEFARAISALHVWPLDLAVSRITRRLDFRSDPADEIIAATSIAHNAPLLTRDRRIRSSKLVPLAK